MRFYIYRDMHSYIYICSVVPRRNGILEFGNQTNYRLEKVFYFSY
ncbi:hypothetical protein MtrunA17_Chr1g0202551 [Medicago truncatula]|uniref:Uncharacterized protein n=1 Tax=Medicago truncatula TaxID=3880 RepID=A0A396K052_MEDTR|nr:hypothetical protein MtrunA17_Chr1g0202551 [Medicago truncatula]